MTAPLDTKRGVPECLRSARWTGGQWSHIDDWSRCHVRMGEGVCK